MSSSQRVIFVVLLLCIAFFATFRLTESPSVWYDEGLYIQTARNVAAFQTYGVQLAPNEFLSGQYMTVGFPLVYPLALSFKLFGYGILEARGTMVFFILCFAITSFALVRKLFGTTSALWSLALLALFPPLYANGKSVLGEVPGLLYLMLSLLFLQYARTRSAGRIRFAILTGLFVGLTCVTKPVFLLLLPALGIVFLYQRRAVQGQLRAVGWGIGAFSIPILVWAVTQFSRTDSLATTLKFYANPYAVDQTSLIHTILNNILNLFTGIGPLFLVGMISVWTGALMLRKRAAEQTSPEEVVAYIFCIISILAYLRTGGFYRYLFPYQAIALLFFPYALSRVITYLRARYNLTKPFFAKTPAIVCTLLILLSGYQLMCNSWVANFYTSTKTAAWEKFFATVPLESLVFFYNTPEVAVFARTEQYHQYITAYRDPTAVQWGKQQLAVVDAGIPDLVIIETRLLEGAQTHLKHYEVSDTNSKYTILSRLPL